MQHKIFFLIISSLFVLSCGNTGKKIEHSKQNETVENALVNHVKLAINPKYQDWVLFKNGTYIVFDRADTISNLEDEALKLMKEYGPVYPASPAGDFSVTHLNQTEGWVVSGHGYGMYTYVHPDELSSANPNDAEIGLYGRNKRDLDGQYPVVIHINRNNIRQ